MTEIQQLILLLQVSFGILAMIGAIYGCVGFAYFIKVNSSLSEDDLFFARVMEIGGFVVFFSCTISFLCLN